MKNKNRNWSTLTYITAFLVGVLMFWSFGKNWMNLESAVVVLAGLIGVVVAVLAFGVWNIFYASHNKKN